jgi:hypothetical protein
VESLIDSALLSIEVAAAEAVANRSL